MRKVPTVYVLMSTYNGERFVREQIESVLNQIDVDVQLIIRDDGSRDNTSKIISEICENKSNVIFLQGKNIGVKKSFFELLKLCQEKRGYFAFCDQDDIWNKDKLKNACDTMMNNEDDSCLYYCAAMSVDEELNELGRTLDDNHVPYEFMNILLKNCALGCTMVFNELLKDNLLKTNIDKVFYKPLHDHWAYLVCCAIGGKIFFDSRVNMLYRQHSNNVVGSHRKITTKIKESAFWRNRNERYRYSCDLYNCYVNEIAEDNKKTLSLICNYKLSIKDRLKLCMNIIANKQMKLLPKYICFCEVMFGRF